jgi:hypothetical protein
MPLRDFRLEIGAKANEKKKEIVNKVQLPNSAKAASTISTMHRPVAEVFGMEILDDINQAISTGKFLVTATIPDQYRKRVEAHFRQRGYIVGSVKGSGRFSWRSSGRSSSSYTTIISWIGGKRWSTIYGSKGANATQNALTALKMLMNDIIEEAGVDDTDTVEFVSPNGIKLTKLQLTQDKSMRDKAVKSFQSVFNRMS